MRRTNGILLSASGVLISVIPPIVCAASFIPIWRERGSGAILSGLVLFIALISAMPLIKLLKRALASPSVPLVWLVIFIIFYALDSIAGEVTVIAFVGLISNTVGAILYKLGMKRRA